ncbi:MAG: NAD(P)/FAD-dependent oxidoreductase [Pseudomonadota bacterium]
MPLAPLNIAIAGAGVGGLAAGALLARDGHKVTIFDRFDAPAAVGSGLMLQKTGLAVLEAMELEARVSALGQPIKRLAGRTHGAGRLVLDVRFEKLAPNLRGLAVQRPALFGALFEAAKTSGAGIVTKATIKSADPKTGALIGSNGQDFGAFDLIVDALGARSPLSTHPRRDLPYGALWATLPWPEDGPFDAEALEQRYLGARQMAGVMASGRAAPGAPLMATYFWSVKGDERDWRSKPLEQWKQQAAALWPETAGLLTHITSHSQVAFARYRHRTHGRPIEGRVVHLGDSWHATSPQLGQGANMALLDAWALAAALSETGALAPALRRYRRLRVAHVRTYQRLSHLLTPVYQSDSRTLPFLRDRLAAPLMRVPPAPRTLAALVSGAFRSPLKRLGLG